LESQVYYILEAAELRGLCAPLSGIRPYTRNVVIAAINEILYSEKAAKLKAAEREILLQYLDQYSQPMHGMDWQRGVYHNETAMGKNDALVSLNIGGNLNVEGSAGFYDLFSERYIGTETWLRFYLNGDLGGNVSWEFSGEGGLIQAPRKFLGFGNTYYSGFEDDPNGEFVNRVIPVYSEPLTHFPYTYKKRWDGSVYFFGELTDFASWPGSFSGGYNLISELTGSFLEDKLIVRLGRLSREWGSAPFGSSLALNQMARPFLGMEAEFWPVSWFGAATMTGVLEYHNTAGTKGSAMNFQNVYSIMMLQARYKNYFFIDFGDAVVWPKRFELGYLSPITNSFFYQNNIGDFDNLAALLNLKARYPDIGNVWFSLFLDEASLLKELRELDRTMIAVQAGMNFSLPFLSFTSLKVSYTRVNPYCYTHNRNFNPWYGGQLPMETSYTNNGVSLGYYLPPNSSEILFGFKTMPARNLAAALQYQMIIHGASYGSGEVDGSSLLSELDPNNRGSNPVLKRFFLHDGAYQWSHIVKIGVEWNLPGLPIALYGEAGVDYSYFTNTAEPANSGQAHSISTINTSEYPKSAGFIVKAGFKVYPR
jgi:hypothetical protein